MIGEVHETLWAMEGIALRNLFAASPAVAPSLIPPAMPGVVAVIGPICKYPSTSPDAPQGVSALRIQSAVEAMLVDPSIDRVILYLDTPGGTVSGTSDLADFLYAARSRKPIIAFVSDNCYSAGYWLASQCAQVFINPAGHVGSIGIYQILVDSSAAAKSKGLALTLVSSGEFKGLDTPGLQISDRLIAETRSRVDSAAAVFCGAIRRGRGIEIPPDGKVYAAEEALAAGLVDGIRTLDEVFSDQSMAQSTTATQTRAEAAPAVTPAAGEGDVLKKILDMLTLMQQQINKIPTGAAPADPTKADDDMDDDEAAKKAVCADRDRLKAIAASLGAGREALALKAFLDGKDAVGAKALLADQLLAENAALLRKNAADGVEPLALGGVAKIGSDPEKLWNENADGIRAKYRGKKEYFLADHKYQQELAASRGETN